MLILNGEGVLVFSSLVQELESGNKVTSGQLKKTLKVYVDWDWPICGDIVVAIIKCVSLSRRDKVDLLTLVQFGVFEQKKIPNNNKVVIEYMKVEKFLLREIQNPGP